VPAPRELLAIERDPDMQRVLAAELAGDAHVEIVAADALAFDYAARRAPRAGRSSSSATCRIRSRARWCWRWSTRARAAPSRARS
jgi:16S rRNA A1518/A1519 N6-dimethyltransferase RsmA/KsgA/DIM1 with predicted DNA glycosylase/AP lyase activity